MHLFLETRCIPTRQKLFLFLGTLQSSTGADLLSRCSKSRLRPAGPGWWGSSGGRLQPASVFLSRPLCVRMTSLVLQSTYAPSVRLTGPEVQWKQVDILRLSNQSQRGGAVASSSRLRHAVTAGCWRKKEKLKKCRPAQRLRSAAGLEPSGGYFAFNDVAAGASGPGM